MPRKVEEYSKHPLSPQSDKRRRGVSDPLAIEGIECLEIFTENAKLTAYFFINAFGFTPIAYRGPETGYRQGVKYVLQQGEVTLVICAAIDPTDPIAGEVLAHGMTVRDISLRVPDCEAFYFEALKRGAESAEAPTEWRTASGSVKRSAIRTYGEVVHSLVSRHGFKGAFWPGYIAFSELFPNFPKSKPCGIEVIDHVVGNVELGEMERWVKFYEKVLGFTEMTHFSDKEISTEYSALMSKVMAGGRGKIKFPINEPAAGKRKSQIEEYLDFHHGPGVQHIALRTNDIIATVSELRDRGVQFLRIPTTYYDEVSKRVGTIKEDLKQIAELGILADRDDDGYLLQIFTQPITDRPTLFFEIIQREGSQGFGVGNFKALFEAIEREQARRGNL